MVQNLGKTCWYSLVMKKNKKCNEDKSIYVPQDEKYKGKIQFKDKIRWTDKQKKFLEISTHKDTRLVLVKGPAGSSKSILSVFAALQLLDQKKVSEVMYVRSAVESSDSKIGYLPGTNEEKMMYYNLPFMEKLEELVQKSCVDVLNKEGRISCFSTNFARGMSWNAKAIIMDEAQNSSRKEIITILTRLGHFSRGFVLADPQQTDLKNGNCGGFEEIYALFDNEEGKSQGIHVFEFTEDDVMRSELVKYLVKKFSELPKPKTH
jgi:phosphate starvation-inducible PhoH-like protein